MKDLENWVRISEIFEGSLWVENVEQILAVSIKLHLLLCELMSHRRGMLTNLKAIKRMIVDFIQSCFCPPENLTSL